MINQSHTSWDYASDILRRLVEHAVADVVEVESMCIHLFHHYNWNTALILSSRETQPSRPYGRNYEEDRRLMD